MALHLLSSGRNPDPFLLDRHNNPCARTILGAALAAEHIPTAMIDLSDGLLADLGHILESSSAGALVEEELLPLSSPFRTEYEASRPLIQLALAGGEDYELLFTVPPGKEGALSQISKTTGLPLTRVGAITEEKMRLLVRDSEGRLYTPSRGGFNHFG
jgi:thiamine-monophosphate kinase